MVSIGHRSRLIKIHKTFWFPHGILASFVEQIWLHGYLLVGEDALLFGGQYVKVTTAENRLELLVSR